MSDPDIFETMPMSPRPNATHTVASGDFIAQILAATRSASRSSEWFEQNLA